MRLSSAPSLAELQRRFQAGILSSIGTTPEFVTAASAEIAEARFHIYREAYRLRLAEALAADYPALSALLGNDAFAELARTYSESRPSQHYSIRWAGAGLAKYLRDRPDLADVAAFEWALSTAFDAADKAPLAAESLGSLPMEQWPNLRLIFHPSLRPIVLRHNAPELWRAATQGRLLPALVAEAAPSDWLVWRRGFAVYYRPLDDGEAWALDAASHDTAFADWCEGLGGYLDGSSDAANTAAGMLRRWIDDGLIVKTETSARA